MITIANFLENVTVKEFLKLASIYLQGGHSSGKPGKVGENRKNQGKSGKMNYYNYSATTITVP